MLRFPEFLLPNHVSLQESPGGGRLELALRLAEAASRATLGYFRTDAFQVERKSDRSPVTRADKEAEQLVRTMVAERYPEDGILGEEFGKVAGRSPFEWIIDPIDGTKSFISGVPLYSTLVGLTLQGEPIIGVIAIPALGELVIGIRGGGAWYGCGNGLNAVALQPTHVSNVEDLADGVFVVSQVDNFSKRGAQTAYETLESKSYISRSWGDGYGYLLVATGRAELMVDPIVNPWDIAAVAPVVVEAGGRFSSWSGEYDIHAGHGFASNGHVHEVALQVLKPYA
jgi:histidinol-phosphatase